MLLKSVVFEFNTIFYFDTSVFFDFIILLCSQTVVKYIFDILEYELQFITERLVGELQFKYLRFILLKIIAFEINGKSLH